MRTSYDAVVIGAGIVGAACAMEFAIEGMSVAVVERDVVAGGATGAAMGHVVVMDDSPAQFALTHYSQSLWHELAPELPLDVEYYRPGTIWVAADEEEWAEVCRKREFYSAHGVAAELLDAKLLAAAEPNLRRSFLGGLLMPADAVLNPSRGAAYLLDKAKQQRAGVDVFLGQTVISAGDGVVSLRDGTRIHSPVIVNATGAVAPELMPGIAVRKRKGHLMITDPCPGFANHQLVELGYLKSAHTSEMDSVAFNVQPRRNGQLLIGSSRQFDSEDPAVEQHMLDAIMDRARLYMPEIGSLKVLRAWTGFRAATPDKLPLIGPSEDPTVLLATGHEGLGITTSLATARLLVDFIAGRRTSTPIDPYLPSRMTKDSSSVGND
ncbi:NAD(P)/FAD-dependent oxidoreductase [Acidicapsa acidisoli]|uniref:NAD(P)/FAD-dependent oxidoreductase n=1 Tax=Acidicapsa acidisoli TaxID=1615681 RepID=UPI0021E04C1B|nr:FAD-dependent oxidoreductase [Acidicapsa acidisoli]